MQSIRSIRSSIYEGEYDSLLAYLYCRPEDELKPYRDRLLGIMNDYMQEFKKDDTDEVMIFSALAILTWFLLLMLVVPLIEKDNAKRGVMVQAMFRSNFVLFGLPVAISLCGEDKIGITSLLMGIIVPVYNVLAVITLEVFRGGKPSIKKIVLGILKNPLIIASSCI